MNTGLEVYTFENYPPFWASIQNNLGLVYQNRIIGDRSNNIEESIRCCERALKVRTRDRFPKEWAETQTNLGLAYSERILGERVENLEESLRCYTLALEVLTREVTPAEWATTQMNLAIAYAQRIRGEPAENQEQALRCYELALQVYTREAFPTDWALTQYNLADTYRERIYGEPAENQEQALHCCELALQVYTREAFPIDWAKTQNHLGAIYMKRIRGERADNLEEAIRCCERALLVRTREASPEDWAVTQHNLGEAYQSRIRGDRAENLEESIRHYELALLDQTHDAYPERWALTQNSLAVAYRNRIRGDRNANHDSAIRHYEAALQIRTEDTYPREWAATNNNLGIVYMSKSQGDIEDNLENAISHFERALQVLTRDQFPEVWAVTHNNLASAFAIRSQGKHSDNLRAAIHHYELSLLEDTVDRNPQRAFGTARNLGILYGEQENWSAAHRVFGVARAAAETLLRSTVTFAGQQAEMRQLAEIYDRDLAMCAELSSMDSNIAREALTESEAARSRAFLRQLGLGDFAPPATIPAALVTQEKNILTQLRDIENNLAGADTRSDRMSELERTLTERRVKLADERERVWNEMLTASPDAAVYISLRRGDTPAWDDLQTLAARLGKDTALVEFHSLADQTLAFVWRAGWDAPKMLSLTLTRERLLYRYLLPYEREVLSTYRRSQAQASERELYHDWLGLGEELLAPLEPLLGGASLVYFIPHQFLHLLPLHALTVNAEPFIARRAVMYAPSAAVLERVLEQNTRDGGDALVMGYTHAAWQRDIFVGEAIEVAKLFGTHVVADEHATRAALAERVPNASLIHLSCHGAFDGGDSLNSAVMLADGAFTAREWMRLNLRADLVTLSACQLAFNDVNPGDDLVGMTRALLYAGASSVLLALWSVRADTTREWMLDFYKRLKPNGTAQAKAHAFRDATLALRTQHDDPYIWAPFMLVGDWM